MEQTPEQHHQLLLPQPVAPRVGKRGESLREADFLTIKKHLQAGDSQEKIKNILHHSSYTILAASRAVDFPDFLSHMKKHSDEQARKYHEKQQAKQQAKAVIHKRGDLLTKEGFEEIKELLYRGESHSSIARLLHRGMQTIQRVAQVPDYEAFHKQHYSPPPTDRDTIASAQARFAQAKQTFDAALARYIKEEIHAAEKAWKEHLRQKLLESE